MALEEFMQSKSANISCPSNIVMSPITCYWRGFVADKADAQVAGDSNISAGLEYMLQAARLIAWGFHAVLSQHLEGPALGYRASQLIALINVNNMRCFAGQ